MNTEQKIDALYQMAVRRAKKDHEEAMMTIQLAGVLKHQFEQMPDSPLRALFVQLCSVFQVLASSDDEDFQENKTILGISSVEGDNEVSDEIHAPVVGLVQSYVQLMTNGPSASEASQESPPLQDSDDRTED